MNPRLFHLTAAAAISVASLTTALTTPVHAPVHAATAAARPAMTVKQQVVSAALVRGYTPREIRCLNRLIYRESRWSPTARNPRSTASGLFQHLRSPSGVMLRDLPVTKQTERGLRYIAHRYGDPCTALAHSLRKGWY